MARVLALVPDLLFGSKVVGMLQAAGHEVQLAAAEADVPAALPRTEVLIVDLASGTVDGVGLVGAARASGDLAGTRTLAFYSHVDTETRAAALEAGFDLVVPRSRMAREGAALVGRLAGDGS